MGYMTVAVRYTGPWRSTLSSGTARSTTRRRSSAWTTSRREVALTLKAQTNVAIFGARNTGKSTFLSVLGRELALEQEADAPPHAMIRIDLKRALSIPAFVACVDDALREHPEHAIRRAAARSSRCSSARSASTSRSCAAPSAAARAPPPTWPTCCTRSCAR